MENINIQSVEEVTSKTGKVYHVVTDNNNKKYSVWDEKVVEKAKAGLGKTFGCTIESKDGFNNLRSLGAEIKDAVVTEEVVKPAVKVGTQEAGFLTAHACNNVLPALISSDRQEVKDLTFKELSVMAGSITLAISQQIKEAL